MKATSKIWIYFAALMLILIVLVIAIIRDIGRQYQINQYQDEIKKQEKYIGELQRDYLHLLGEVDRLRRDK